ncbi:MAG: HAD family hydrolase, partial [bacterium]|nr:HAD family hydrolase [bacterium]MDW8164017.1 HAD family hydrolase [Candidatus Omnitrophota bacterium]
KNEKLLKIINKKNIGVSNKIKKVIKYLKDKYKIGIASNSEKKFVLKVLELSGLNKFIDVVVTKSDVQNPKPFPDIYNKVSKKLKIPISNLIAFEDSETGILSAKTSGIFCVGVLTTQPLEKIKMADIIIDEINLKNVKKIIKIFEGKNENKKY